MSVAWPPICRPKLAPVIVRKAGNDHSPVLTSRALMIPRPRWAPKMNPPRTVEGKIAMASTFDITERGTPASSARMIACSACAESQIRSASSDCADAAAGAPSIRQSTAAATA